MSRIAQRFAELRAAGRKGLIPYIAAGDPEPALTVPLLHALARAGADVVELGVPFSDPMADGPVVQRATERAIRNGVGLRQTIEFVRQFRLTDTATPIVLMGYPTDRAHGPAGLRSGGARSQGRRRVGGRLSAGRVRRVRGRPSAAGIDPIFLLAPTSTDQRIERVARHAAGYIYYVSLKGITGAGHLDVAGVAAKLPLIRRHSGCRQSASAYATQAARLQWQAWRRSRHRFAPDPGDGIGAARACRRRGRSAAARDSQRARCDGDQRGSIRWLSMSAKPTGVLR